MHVGSRRSPFSGFVSVVPIGLATIVFVLAPVCLLGAEPAKTDVPTVVKTGPTPTWVEPVTWSVPDGPAPAGAAAQVLLNDGQDRLTTSGSDYYYHSIVRLLTAEGVRRNAEPTNEFAPEYQEITWHTLKIYRNGEVLDRLPTAKFKRLQRELGLEAQMLSGQETLATVLEDVRVGDVLECAFSLHDENPLFAGQLSTRHYLGSPYPTAHERIVIHVPREGPSIRASFVIPDGTRDLPQALFTPSGLRSALADDTNATERVIRWESTGVPPIPFDEALPARAYPYWPLLRASSFKTWADVVEWAEPLFAEQKLPDVAAGLVEKWRKEQDPVRRLAAAVHWVQDDIRYFALSLGEHNLRPRPLNDVCTTRFGDCKDKALLLAHLLRALGIEAWPALVNTYWRDRLHDVTPHPYAFNHAIVAYRLGNRLHWIDATLKNQQGPAGEWAVPPYRCALIVRHNESDLTAIDEPALDEPDTTTFERIIVDGTTGDATVDTHITVSGLQADLYREMVQTMTEAERTKRWFNFITRFYKHLEPIGDPTLEDDIDHNQIKIHLQYHVPEFSRTEHGETVVNTYAYALRALLDPPESRRRHWPYALVSDRFIRHRIEVELPFTLPVEQQPEAIRSDGVEYRVERGVAGKRLFAQHDLKITGDYVGADRMSQYCDAVDEILNGLATSLHRPVATTDGTAKPVTATSP